MNWLIGSITINTFHKTIPYITGELVEVYCVPIHMLNSLNLTCYNLEYEFLTFSDRNVRLEIDMADEA